MPASDKAGASKGGARDRRSRKPRVKRNIFATEEEVDNRNRGSQGSGLYMWSPTQTFPEFRQIKPVSVTGRSITQATFKDLPMKGVGTEGFKFTGGIKRPNK